MVQLLEMSDKQMFFLLKQVCSWCLRFNLWSEEEWRLVTCHRDSMWTTVAGKLRAKMPEGFMLELDGNNKACLFADVDVWMNLTVPICGAKLNWTTLLFLTSHSSCTFCLLPGGDCQSAFSLLPGQWVHTFYSRDVTDRCHRHPSHNRLKKPLSFAEQYSGRGGLHLTRYALFRTLHPLFPVRSTQWKGFAIGQLVSVHQSWTVPKIHTDLISPCEQIHWIAVNPLKLIDFAAKRMKVGLPSEYFSLYL